MPATVKSLEERIDEMAGDFASVQAQLGVIVGTQSTIQAQLASIASAFSTTQAQLAVVVARLDTTIDELKATRTRLDTIAVDYAAFKSKAETTFALVRWIGATATVALVSIIVAAFAVARSAGSLETTVQHHQKSLDEINKRLAESHKAN